MALSSFYILAVDLGTSGPKSALIGAAGDWLDDDFAPNEILYQVDGGAEQDPKEWWSSIAATWDRLRAHNVDAWKRIVAISVTAQWSGTVALDQKGDPIGNALIWLDSRGRYVLSKYFGGWPKISGYGIDKIIRWVRLTGGIAGLSGKDSLAHILYIKDFMPEVYNNTATFLEVKDYINYLLTGKKYATYDSIILHWLTDNRAIDNIHYHEPLLQSLALEKSKFPDLIGATDILGPITSAVAERFVLPQNTQVVGGAPDMQSAAVGSGSYDPTTAHIYIGTSSWISTHVPYKKTDLFHNIASLPSALPGKYFIPATQETAGAVLKHMKDEILCYSGLERICEDNFFVKMDHLAESAPAGSQGLIFTPWMYGERCPVENSALRATHWNLSLDAALPDYLRSQMEGVALNLRWLLQHVERFVGNRFAELNFTGGGSASQVWSQILADVLQRPIHQIDNGIRVNLFGAFVIAQIALKIQNNEPGSYIKIQRTFEPNKKNEQLYNIYFSKFLYLYRQSNKIYRKLRK